MPNKPSRPIPKKSVAAKVASSTPAPGKPGKSSSPHEGIVLRGGRVDKSPAIDNYGHDVPAPVTGWAGEVVLEGFREADKDDILGLIRHTGQTGPRDEDDRVLNIEFSQGKLRVLTAENRLAVSIGKRVHRSHKGGKLTITWSNEDMPVRVHWIAKK